MSEDDPHRHRTRARQLLELGRYEAAASEATAALSASPDDGAARALLSLALLALGRRGEALEQASRSVGEAPEEPGTWYALACAHDHHRAFAEARGAIGEAIARAPEDPLLWETASVIALRAGDPAEAAGDARRALALHPGRTGAVIALASALAATGAHTDSESLLTAQLAIDPEHPRLPNDNYTSPPATTTPPHLTRRVTCAPRGQHVGDRRTGEEDEEGARQGQERKPCGH